MHCYFTLLLPFFHLARSSILLFLPACHHHALPAATCLPHPHLPPCLGWGGEGLTPALSCLLTGLPTSHAFSGHFLVHFAMHCALPLSHLFPCLTTFLAFSNLAAVSFTMDQTGTGHLLSFHSLSFHSSFHSILPSSFLPFPLSPLLLSYPSHSPHSYSLVIPII